MTNLLVEPSPSYTSTVSLPLSGNSQPLISVVLLSYNRPGLLKEALTSLQHQSHKNLDITVVDNPSPASAAVASVVSQYPKVKLIQTDTNQGYSGGMNRGIEQASGHYLFLTEDDIVLESDCIERLVEYMDESPSADLISPIIFNKTARTIRCAGGGFTLGGVYRKEVYGEGESDAGQFSQPFDVNYIDGASMFARKEFWQQFKGFRQEYFMYVDAVELCARVIKAGKRMTVLPQAKVYHFEPTVGSATEDMEFHKLKNMFSLYLLHAPARVLPEFFCRYAVINGVRSLFRKNGNHPQVFVRALLWVARKTPSLLKERYAGK